MKNFQKIIFLGNFTLLILIFILSISSVSINHIKQESIIMNDVNEQKLSPITQNIKVDHIFQTEHEPIIITGNIDFANHSTNEGWNGNGSIDNPYIISNYHINTSGDSGIEINNTDVYFIIENVTIIGTLNLTRDASNNMKGAFQFSNVTNGKLIRNTAKSSYYGFMLYRSMNNKFIGNNATDNYDSGFHLNSSCNNTITENNVFYNLANGISLYKSNNSLISKNKVLNNTAFGIKLNISENCILSENIVSNHCLLGIYLVSSTQNTLSRNTAKNNCLGIGLAYNCSSNVIKNNYITKTILYSICLEHNCSENVICNNNVVESYNSGIILYNCAGNIICNNNLTKNFDYGIVIFSNYPANNYIYLNTFIENNNGNCQAISDCQNYWDNGTHGNYWSDYTGKDSNGDGIGDKAYKIFGVVKEFDFYPLMTSFDYSITPKNSPSFSYISLIVSFTVLIVLFKKRWLTNCD